MKTVIIAAGKGSRLGEKTEDCPKTLLPFGGGTILSHILNSFRSIGITQFGLVVGYQSERIVDYLDRHEGLGLNITTIDNPNWHRGNGLSVLAASAFIGEDETFLLSMSDHLVSTGALSGMVTGGKTRNELLVDPRPELVFDIEDATKVRCDRTRILSLGKTLNDFNGVDCGIFKLTQQFLSTAEEQMRRGMESLSDFLQPLIDDGELIPVFIPDGSTWIDIDTPEAYQHAIMVREKLIL